MTRGGPILIAFRRSEIDKRTMPQPLKRVVDMTPTRRITPVDVVAVPAACAWPIPKDAARQDSHIILGNHHRSKALGCHPTLAATREGCMRRVLRITAARACMKGQRARHLGDRIRGADHPSDMAEVRGGRGHAATKKGEDHRDCP
jgi:hypothetical protein